MTRGEIRDALGVFAREIFDLRLAIGEMQSDPVALTEAFLAAFDDSKAVDAVLARYEDHAAEQVLYHCAALFLADVTDADESGRLKDRAAKKAERHERGAQALEAAAGYLADQDMPGAASTLKDLARRARGMAGIYRSGLRDIEDASWWQSRGPGVDPARDSVIGLGSEF